MAIVVETSWCTTISDGYRCIRDSDVGKKLIEWSFAGDLVGDVGKNFWQAVFYTGINVGEEEVAVAVNEGISNFL